MLMNAAQIRKLSLATVTAIAVALPVSASLWPATPRPDAGGLDLAAFDAVTRVGAAQQPTDPFCDAPEVVAISLTEDYAETQIVSALTAEGQRLDFWAADTAGTWTVIYTRADGISCVVGSGTGWQSGAEPASFLRDAGVSL